MHNLWSQAAFEKPAVFRKAAILILSKLSSLVLGLGCFSELLST